MQPIVMLNKVARFKKNWIVDHLLLLATKAGYSLNNIAVDVQGGTSSVEDQVQLAQLIGYSVGGFGDLSYVPKALVRAADAEVEKLIRKKKLKRPLSRASKT